jgi:predicted peptidase
MTTFKTGFAFLLLFLVSLPLTGCTHAMPTEEQVNKQMRPGTGFQRRRVVLDGRERIYWVFLPNNYTPIKKWTTILFLHGWAQGGTGGAAASNSGLGEWLTPHAKTFPFIAVFPQAANGWWEDPVDQDDAMRVLKLSEEEFRIDPDRITLMGISTGGHAAWEVAARYREQFSALVTFAARADVDVAPKIAEMPIWMFHNETDPIIFSSNSTEMLDALKKAGGHPRFTRVPGIGHYVWEKGQKDELFEWLMQQRRPGAAVVQNKN